MTKRIRTLGALASVAALTLTVGCDAVAVETTDGSGDPAPSVGTDPQRSAAAQPNAKPEHKPESEPKPRRQPESEPKKEPQPASKPATEPERPAPLLNVGAEGKAVREAQARLQQLGVFERNATGYYGPITAESVRTLQRKQGLERTGTVTEATWRVLRARTTEPTREQLYPQTSFPVAKPDQRCLTGRVLCISKKSRTLAWMVDGRVVSAMDVRFGSQYTPTREGTFKVDFKSRDHHSTLYDTPMPYAMFFSGGQAVHYSGDFAATGYNGASHGCVNVREKEKIAKVFKAVKPGDKVIVAS